MKSFPTIPSAPKTGAQHFFARTGLIFLICLASTDLRAVEESTHQVTTQARSFDVGISYQILHPNNLPNFDLPVAAYGPFVAIPLGKDAIQIQGIYGSNDKLDLALYLIESTYRLYIHTPYLSAVGLLGGQFLKYTSNEDSFFGVHTGLGISFSTVESVEARLEMKIYFQRERIVSFGGGISYQL